MKQTIGIIGGGASGLAAAYFALHNSNNSVHIFEKQSKIGRKVAASGNGRCNLTNIAEISDFIKHFGSNGRFLHQAFARFFSPELITFFEGRGLALSTERGGRVFPTCGKASRY